jgi:seryl-tRNA synthetase
MTIDPRAVPGLSIGPDGSVGLYGPLLQLFERLDAAFVRLSRPFSAEPRTFPPLLAVRHLRALDYFTSFPHLVTLPVGIAREAGNLERFRAGNGADREGPLTLAELAPVETVLAPAACYAIYPALGGSDLGAEPRTITLLGTCFRREDRYEPLRRQWCFRMREIVHIGSAESVGAFLAKSEELVRRLASQLDLPITTATATDPFFDPARSPRYLHQKLFPTKSELVFDGDLAIGSFNYHRSFFGETFAILHAGRPAHTGCTAFGVERWLWAILARHGLDPRHWPSPAEETA